MFALIRKRLAAQALMAFVVVIGLYFGYSFAREVVQAESLTRQAESGAARNEALKADIRKLERDLQYYQSDEYAEVSARENLNLRRPDETVIFTLIDEPQEVPSGSIAQAVLPTPVATVTATPPLTTTVTTARNWDGWFSLITTTLR